MDRAQAGAVRGRLCPGCAAELGRPRGSGGDDANGECSRCGGSVSAERARPGGPARGGDDVGTAAIGAAGRACGWRGGTGCSA